MPAVHFGAQWETATGKSQAAFLDSSNPFGGWGAYNGPAGDPVPTNASEIVAGGSSLVGRGNFFRVFNDGTNNLTVRKDNAVPAVTTHFGRVYVRNQKNVGAHNHPIAIGGLSDPVSNIVTVPLVVTGVSGATQIQCQTNRKVDGTLSGYRRDRWTPGTGVANTYSTLLQNQWYLQEWEVRWLSATRYNLYVWTHLVDAAGMITTENLFTSATYYAEDYFGNGATLNLAAVQTANTDIYGFAAGDLTGQYVFGNEGPGGGSTNGEHFEMASFGLSLEGRLRDQPLFGGSGPSRLDQFHWYYGPRR